MLRRLIGLIDGGASERRRKARKAEKRKKKAPSQLSEASLRQLWHKHRPYQHLDAKVRWPEVAVPQDNDAEIQRLMQAYRSANERFRYDTSSMWSDFFKLHHAQSHAAFLADDVAKVRDILGNPGDNHLFYGFDNLYQGFIKQLKDSGPNAKGYGMVILDHLIRLGEATGALRLENPEGGPWLASAKFNADQLLPLVENGLGFTLECPEIYPLDVGLATARGALTYRAVHAAYQAYRLRELAGDRPPASLRVCEIGGGLGRTAYYANLAGFTDYTLVDIPFTAISQGYFLMRALGPECVSLSGEAPGAATQVRLMAPEEFHALERRFDIILNVDSITEFGPDTCATYLAKIATLTDRFLSINHEINQPRVFEAVRACGRRCRVQRHPYWMRHGYAEELVDFL